MAKLTDTELIGKYIGRKIRLFMDDNWVTVLEVANKLGVKSPNISTILSGRSYTTNLDRYEKIARATWMSKSRFDEIVIEARRAEMGDSEWSQPEISEDYALKSLVGNNPAAQEEAKSVIQYIKQKYGLK